MNESKATRLSRLLLKLVNDWGFTASEVHRLIRIEGTLSRWSEAECNGEIQRDETGKPFRHFPHLPDSTGYIIPDREGNALKRLAAIVTARNERLNRGGMLAQCLKLEQEGMTYKQAVDALEVFAYHQGDPRGCSLYLVLKSALKTDVNQIVTKAQSWGANIRPHASGFNAGFINTRFDTEEAAALAYLKLRGAKVPARWLLPLDQYYTRGTAVYV